MYYKILISFLLNLAIFDQYTQKEHRKFNNKTANNQNNFVVETDDGSIELAAALRYERMYAGDKPIRTKGRDGLLHAKKYLKL